MDNIVKATRTTPATRYTPRPGTYPTQDDGEATVEITINLDAIAKDMTRKALRNKTKRAAEIDGAVTVTVTHFRVYPDK